MREHRLHTVPVDRALHRVLRYAGFLQLATEAVAERRAAGEVPTVVRYEVDADELPEEIAGETALEIAEDGGRWVSTEFLARASVVALARALVGPDDATAGPGGGLRPRPGRGDVGTADL